jgi:predicted dehydrogenase
MRCIITGLGGRGLHWNRQLCQRKDCQLTGFVEPAEENRTRAVQQHDIPESLILSSLAEALERVEADFVLDVTPPAVHREVAERAFAAGLHVLGEKPLSDDFRVAREIAAAGERAGVKHMITQNYRFGACPRTTRRRLAEGLIGKPGQCDIRFYMPWADMPGSHYVTQPYMLINDMMVHHFDMLRSVLGQDPVSVQAITWNHPWGWHEGDAAHAIVFHFPDGLVGTHVSVGCAVGSRTTWNGDWRIEGPEGSIDWEQDRMWHAHLHRTPERLRTELFPLAVPQPEQAILDEFFASIREEREPECSARDNLKSLAMVFGAIKSTKEGRRVELAELNA